MRALVRAVLSPLRVLYDPNEFFARRRNRSALRAAGVVTLVALATTAGVALVGWWFAGSIDATATVTTMEPWPDSSCESFAQMNASGNASSTPEACAIDEPRTRQVAIGPELWDAFVGKLPLVFVSPFLGWLIVAAGLHVLSALYGGEGRFGATMAVAGWAMLPTLVATAVGIATAYARIHAVEFASDPEVLAGQLREIAAIGDGPIVLLVSVAVTLWQGYIWTFGLVHARDLERTEALYAAGIATVVALVFTLVG